jgi:hypothetical protein
MKRWPAQAILFRLGTLLAVCYLLVGIIAGVWPSHWNDSPTSDQVLWIVLLVGGGAVVLIGLRLFERFAWLGAALVSIGALVGALVIFWTVVAPLGAIALVVLSLLCARRGATSSPTAARG